MSELISQIERILKVRNINSQICSDLIVNITDKGCWRFYYNYENGLNVLSIEPLSSDREARAKSCKIKIDESLFIKILNGNLSQQDAYNQGLFSAEGTTDQLIEANIIIDSLRESFV